MPGSSSPILSGVAAVLCAAMAASVAPASPTFQTVEIVDFPGVSATNVPPIFTPDDAEAAVRVMAYPFEPEASLALPSSFVGAEVGIAPTTRSTLALPTSTWGGTRIDAGQIEAMDGWTSLIETPVGWRAPRDDSADQNQPGFFSAAAVSDAGTAELVSSVSVIPLPAALTSAAATAGLIAGAWAIRRLRSGRSPH